MSNLSDLYIFQYGKGNTNPDNGGRFPIYGSNGIIGGYHEYNSEDAPVIGHIGANCGEVIWGHGKHYVTYNGIICKVKQNINKHFAYYTLLNSKLKDRIRGSAQPFISYDLLNEVVVRLPDIEEQKRIGNLLWSIDSKIRNNNAIISELEVLTRTIYDYWFLQFEFPNEEGMPYKSSGGDMVWNEELKREIPDGWEVRTIQNIESKIITGKTPSTKNASYFNGNIPFITIGDIRNNMHIVKTVNTLSDIGANTQENKYIPEGSICVTCIASPGLVGFSTTKSQTNQQINTIVCRNAFNRMYLFFAIKDYFLHSKGAKTGNTFANMSKEDFSNIKLLYPNEKILKEFALRTNAIFEMVLTKSKENQELTSLRDFLLPLLMNGQVTFKES